MSDTIEFEIQRQMLERLKIEWPPGEPFYAVVEGEITRLRTIREKQRERIVAADDEIERLRGQVS